MTPAEDVKTHNIDFDRLKRDIKAHVDGINLYEHLHRNPKGNIRNGGTVRCVAAGHEDSDPSMQLFEDGFNCKGCGEGGDVIAMWSVAYGRTQKGEIFNRTLFELADYAGLSIDRYTTDGKAPNTPKPKPVPQPKNSTNGAPSKHRQNTTDKLNPPDIRVEIFERIWQAVKPTDLTDAAIEYLEDKNINPLVAKSYGCRDWYAARSDINGVIGDYDIGELKKAGLCKGDGDPSKMLKAVNGSNWHQGLAFPLWHPEYPNAPVAVRWRHYNGTKRPSQPSSHLAFEAPPLGLLEPSPQNQSLVNESYCDAMIISGNLSGEKHHREWWNDKTPRNIGNYPGNYAVVFCEGETDWLSVASAAAELETSMRIVPVGVTSMSSSWPERWTPEIEGADKVAVMFDYGNPDNDNPKGAARRDEIEEQLRDRWSPVRVDDFVSHLREDDEDLNTLRENGVLTDKLIEVLFNE